MKYPTHRRTARRLRLGVSCLALGAAVSAAWADDDAALGLEIGEPAAPAAAPATPAARATPAKPAQDDALPALAEPPAAPAAAPRKAGNTRLSAEALVATTGQRYGLGEQRSHRLSLGLTHSQALNGDWRVQLANRLDVVDPDEGWSHGVVNSLREAYASWQPAQGAWSVDAGRVNLRQGTSYGFNPTDFLRSGAVRLATSADPQVLREGRLGTGLVRAQWLGTGRALSLALAPKLASAPSSAGWNPSFGSTNGHSQVLLSGEFSQHRPLSLQLSAYGSDEGRALAGLNASLPLGQSAIGTLELAAGRDRRALALVDPTLPAMAHAVRASSGVSLSLPAQTSLTVEYQYDGFAPGKGDWNPLRSAATPSALGGYLLALQDRQDNATRHAVFVHAMARSVVVKALDTSLIVRHNLDDSSRLVWLEARWHLSGSDLALQWQGTTGGADSEYGVLPLRRSIGLLWNGYF